MKISQIGLMNIRVRGTSSDNHIYRPVKLTSMVNKTKPNIGVLTPVQNPKRITAVKKYKEKDKAKKEGRKGTVVGKGSRTRSTTHNLTQNGIP